MLSTFTCQDEPTTRLLRLQPWFTALPPETRHELIAQTVTLRAKKGTTMLWGNEASQGWYGVLSGLVKLEHRASSGRNATYLGLAAGEWFGEGSVLRDAPRGYDVIALRDTELVCLPMREFRALHATNLAFNQFLVERLNLRLGQAMAIIDAGRTRTPEQRIALALSSLFWSRSRQLELSQDELASLAGMSRQTANQSLKLLQERGLVSLSMNRIKVLNDAALTGLLSPSTSTDPVLALDRASL